MVYQKSLFRGYAFGVDRSVWMNSFHVYGFTLVSGYIFYHVKYNLGRYTDYKVFLINKAKRLLIPYAFVAVLWVVPFQCFFMKIDVIDILKNYAFGVSPSQLWFLLMLFNVFAIMWLLSDFLCKHTVTGGAVIVAIYLIGMIGPRVFLNLFQIWTTCRYCLFFWMGMKLCQYVGSHGVSVLRKIPTWLWILTDIALYSVIKLIPESNIFFELLATGLNLLLNMIGALMSFVVFGKLSEIVPWKTSKAFLFLSKFSFPIYLFHQQLVFCAIYLLNGKINPYLNASINILIAIGGSLLISCVFMRFKVTRILIGETSWKSLNSVDHILPRRAMKG